MSDYTGNTASQCRWCGDYHGPQWVCDQDGLRREIERLRTELHEAGDGDTWREACGRCEAEITRLRWENTDLMCLEYALREWAAGRLTDEGLKEQLAASTAGVE